MNSLYDVKDYTKVNVRWNTCTQPYYDMTVEMGIECGNNIYLLRKYPNHVIIKVNQKEIVLSKDLAQQIKVV